jgi:DNA-binding XRE family transcriptional regulator
MSGTRITRITDQQVRLYMSKRKHHSQEIAAAKAGISVRSARRIERDAEVAPLLRIPPVLHRV